MSTPEQTVQDELRVTNRARFELELEFVQALANPFYLHSLGWPARPPALPTTLD
jgi:mediator of RNA polymerase II transcription subunit 31